MKNSPSWRVSPLDKQVLVSLCSTVLSAKLDAFAKVEDLQHAEGNVYVDHLKFWETEAHRLDTGHQWLLELLAQS